MKPTTKSSIARYNQCRKYLNRTVEIKTVHGVYRGKLVKVDKHRVYLQSSKRADGKATVSFFPFLLPLVLFDLLAIVLLDRGRRCRRCFF